MERREDFRKGRANIVLLSQLHSLSPLRSLLILESKRLNPCLRGILGDHPRARPSYMYSGNTQSQFSLYFIYKFCLCDIPAGKVISVLFWIQHYWSHLENILKDLKLFETCLLFLAKLLMFQWFDAVVLLYKNGTTREISDESDLKLCFDNPQKTPRQILGLAASENSLYAFVKLSANSRQWLHLFSKLIQSRTAT